MRSNGIGGGRGIRIHEDESKQDDEERKVKDDE
jgi:hypothetical protein